MDIFLQIWGGLCYLLNKVFLSFAENSENERVWRIYGWILYLVGLPAWVIILVGKHNWIAASIETGGAPSMLLGLIVAAKGIEQTPRLLQKCAAIFAFGLLFCGVSYSLYDYRGITSVSQMLEICVMAGFLVGTYLLAKKNPNGWYWFILMNLAMGTLMAIQSKSFLAVQQAVSLCFVVRGLYVSKRNKSSKN